MATPSPATVAIGVKSITSKATQRAVRWALENDVITFHHAHRFILIHVIPTITSIPTPCGNHIPITEMEVGVVSIYKQDMKSECDEIFLPFKKLCKTREVEVETLILEDDTPPKALLRYMSETGCKNLVLGCSSSNYITRKLKGPDVSSIVLKFAPNTCNIFLVARNKLLTKLTDSSSVAGASPAHGKLTPTSDNESMDSISNKLIHCDSTESKLSRSSEASSLDHKDLQLQAYIPGVSPTSTSLKYTHEVNHPILRNEESNVQIIEENRCMTFDEDAKQFKLQEELERMQVELRNTLILYDQTCGDLVHVQKKVQSLSYECLEEARRVNTVLDREEMLRKIVAEQKAKHLEAQKEVEVSKQVLAHEIHKKKKAEMTAFMESWKKQEIIDALFSSDKRYRKYTKDEIELATEFFSENKKIGEGGYGRVYKCTLDHTPVAVKIFRADSSDKKQEFLREVEVLSQLRHPNLVTLLAACPEIGCLVYEYMENGSLEELLYCRKGTPALPWFIRIRIAFEVASCLAFLHSSKPEPIVHRDLKPGNILLDRNYVSKIGDVGLAKIMSDVVPDNVTEYRDSFVAGTLYYLDPEYQRTGTIRPKSDVYAFGVIVLQLLTARHPKGLIMTAENAINNNCFVDILDKSISDWPLAASEKLAHIALKCTKLRCRDRPDLEYEVLPELKQLQSLADFGPKLQKNSICAPNHYFCPILQDIMIDPYIAADGFTYEYRAIKAWLEKYNVSPVTGMKLPHTMLTPNKTFHSSIQEWRQRMTS